MFSLVSGVYNAYWAPQQLNLLVVGAKGTGKTGLLERIKVTQFDRAATAATNTEGKPLPADILHGAHIKKKIKKSKRKDKAAQNPSPPPPPPPQYRRSWVCPSPAKYQSAAAESSDEEDDDIFLEEEEEPTAPKLNALTDRNASLESVELNQPNDSETTQPTTTTSQNTTATTMTPEFDLKPKAKMLPLSKVRPTIGMNLGKVDICGAKCRVWDLGGRLQDLWQRYYDDCDAVMFVWKLRVDDDEESPSDDDDDDDRPARVTLAQQRRLLEQVRKAIPDEVPFLVLVHFWEVDLHPLANHRYTTAPYLLPNYHNPLQALFLANARTGHGVRSALQWLIPLAKKQQRLRDKPLAVADIK